MRAWQWKTTAWSTWVGAALALAAAASNVPQAHADNILKQSNSVWKSMDKCAQAAQKAYPDHTAEANKKREEARQRCLRNGNLPGETAAAPAQPPSPTR
jgi:hypothetical protein